MWVGVDTGRDAEATNGERSEGGREGKGDHAPNKSFTSPEHLRNAQSDKKQFAELQQYIDELTKEKYDLERALHQHARLMETLHEENSHLTTQFNWQAQKVSTLEEQMGQFEGEISAQTLVMGNMSMQREEAQRGNTDAFQRAQTLAKEVVMLEEKNLQLSSRELKAQHELKHAQSELEHHSKALTSVEADRKDLRFAVAALQEQQRILTSRLRR